MIEAPLKTVGIDYPYAGEVIAPGQSYSFRITAPRPTPDSSSRCGEEIAPAARMTSRRAVAVIARPSTAKRTPVARLPSKVT